MDAPTIASLDPEGLEVRLRTAASRLFPERALDESELRHLARVIIEGSLLLTDVYSEERLRRIMSADLKLLNRLVDRLIEEERRGEGEVLYRVRRLPETVRIVGDKALFDIGVRGLRQVRGVDLEELGTRAYRLAGQTLELLAQDRRLREFFKQNRLLMLPLEDEVGFLRQCSDSFPIHADILHSLVDPLLDAPDTGTGGESAAALTVADGAGDTDSPDAYVEAARAGAGGPLLSRDQLLSAYERMVLFSALDLERIRTALEATVIDQQPAIAALCDDFSLFAAGTHDPRKPPAYFLVGPTGVGKNHLVETLCRLLEGIWETEIPLLTIEAPNYTYPSDINELRGATRGFIRSDEDGLMTAFHERSSKAPLSVILVDEIEKAHPQLLQFFLPILDRGTTTDNRGSVLSFSNCLVFFTSNLGYSDAQQGTAPIGYMDGDERRRSADREIRSGLRRGLTPEFMNRVRIVHFQRLGEASARAILALELERIQQRYRELHDLELTLCPSATEELLRLGFSPEYGARHLSATLERVCNVEVARRLRQDDRADGEKRRRLVGWLREVRSGKRPFDLERVKERVVEGTRARPGYRELRVTFSEGRFHYGPVEEPPAS